MIDYKATIKSIHSVLSDLSIDELLIILDCIKEIPNYNNSVHINSEGYTYPSVDNSVNCTNVAKKCKDNEANSSI